MEIKYYFNDKQEANAIKDVMLSDIRRCNPVCVLVLNALILD